jgi:cytochrome c553
MNAFARGARENQPAMTAMMKALTEDERRQLATYLGGL